MKDIVSKFSLYDILAMVIPGGLIIAILGNYCGFIPFVIETEKHNAFFVYSILFTGCYIVGLIYNHIIELLCKGIRNNPFSIKYARFLIRKDLKKIPKKYYKNNIHRFLWVVRMYIKCLCPKFRHKYNHIINQYYIAYYYTMTQTTSTISIMESQVSFLRNMFLPILLILFQFSDFFACFENSIGVKLLYIIVVICIPMTIIGRQNKIYQRVWEDYEYLLKYR